ncbi:MAG: hypothetical protein K6G62_00760 [Eubacterium sp.]|nr:hypothetical protein [Eubacterium sp.]
MYTNYIEKIRKALEIETEKKQDEAILEKMDELTQGARNFKEKIKITKTEEYQTLLNDYEEAVEKVHFLEKCLKTAIECNAKDERNTLRKAIQENIEKLNKPAHYKRTKELIESLINENNLKGTFWSNGHCLSYQNNQYDQRLHLCRLSDGVIDPNQDFNLEKLPAPDEIEKAVREAHEPFKKCKEYADKINTIAREASEKYPNELSDCFRFNYYIKPFY